MGPRSDNRGYENLDGNIRASCDAASMGPRSDNRGYEADDWMGTLSTAGLQWVHGPITVVMFL